jgi:hypothetical protein
VTLNRLGQQDEKIRTEYEAGTKKKGCLGEWLDRIVSLVLCVLLLIAFVFSVYVAVQDNTYFENVPTLKVVNSNSMAKRLSTNKYLYEHDLGNQFYTFDLICVYKTPDQYDLELYDIVVYQQDDIEVVHRIVGIEEPNAEHPDERDQRTDEERKDRRGRDRPIHRLVIPLAEGAGHEGGKALGKADDHPEREAIAPIGRADGGKRRNANAPPDDGGIRDHIELLTEIGKDQRKG